MPTEDENVKYLYLVLTHGGSPTIDWDPVCAALELNKGAVTKRWSRLKQAMEKGDNPGGSTYQFLWLCVKHHKRDKAPDWKAIADECGTTAGAASKRYSRMKQAFEQGNAPPGASPRSPVKNTPSKATPKSTPKKTKATTSSGDDVEAITTPKRKRATPKKKTLVPDEQKFKPEPEVEDDEEDIQEEAKRKRSRVTKPKTTPKPKGNDKAKTNGTAKKVNDIPTPTTEATTLIKGEDDGEDAFYDAKEHADYEEEAHGEVVNDPSASSDTVLLTEDCAQCECDAREIANVLMSRGSRLASQQRVELEQIVGVVDLTG